MSAPAPDTSHRRAEQLPASRLKLRRMAARDVPQIMEIESVSFGRHHWSEDSFHNEMNNQIARYFTVLDIGGETERVLGYCGLWFILDEGHVTTVAVRPEFRGHALGELQFVHLLSVAYGLSMKWITLEVRTSNEGAQNLYYKYGMNVVGTRPKYYQDNREDALIMTTPDMATDAYRRIYRENRDALFRRLGGEPAGFGR
ncbi:MAG: ribosomal protein S18-alanine N-acetyltransferase [Candidatus Melainabacteria bacterium]